MRPETCLMADSDYPSSVDFSGKYFCTDCKNDIIEYLYSEYD